MNVFSTKSTNWDTILTFPNGDGNAIFCGHPRRSSRLQFSGILIPCVWSGPGIWTRHFPLCSQALYRLFRAYYISFNSSNVGNLFWSWILKDCIKGQFGCRLVFPSSTKREIRYFHVLVVQWRQGNVQKSVRHVQELLFCQSKPIAFCHSRWCRRRPCLSFLFIVEMNPHLNIFISNNRILICLFAVLWLQR